MRKGQALIFIFILMLMIAIFVSGLSRLWETQINSYMLQREGLAALYAAQAGIERAKIEARINPGLTGWWGWFNIGDARYSFAIQDTGSNTRLIRSSGEKLDSLGNLISRRQLEVSIQGIGTLPSSDDSQVSWSWKEL